MWFAPQRLVETRPHVGPSDDQGPGSGEGGTDVDTDLIRQEREVGERGVHGAGDQEPPLPPGQEFPVALPGSHGTPASRGVVGLLAQEEKRPGQAVARDRGDRGAVPVDAGAGAGGSPAGGGGGGA